MSQTFCLRRIFACSKTVVKQNKVSIFLLIILCFLYGYFENSSGVCVIHRDINCSATDNPNYFIPIVKLYGIKIEDPTLAVVRSVFEAVGYRVHSTNKTNWDVLWSHSYPFHTLQKELTNMNSYQKVNHFPGTGYVTTKSSLAKLSVKNIPKSFLLPSEKEDFLNYAQNRPDIFWLKKNSDHRGVQILNGTENLARNHSFIQELIKNPFVINKKKFDIGIYVMITSIDPLLVYIYSGEILLRFCTENYYPLNINSVDSYVVGDNYLPIWKITDLKFYYSELNYTAKESLNAYLQSKGKSPKKMWSQIHATICDVYFKAEHFLKKSSLTLGHLRNYFELVRFDFVVDENLNAFLLEVNMSPNLSPAHFPQNLLLYEQIVFSSLSLVGLIRKFPTSFLYRGEAEVSEKDIQVFAEQCASEICHDSCKVYKCKVCNQCLNKEWKSIMKTAFLEHMNHGKYQRIIPVRKDDYLKTGYSTELSEMNSIMDLWFKGKCLQDSTWC